MTRRTSAVKGGFSVYLLRTMNVVKKILESRALPYIAPFAVYLLLSQAAALEIEFYYWLYPLCFVITSSVMVLLLRGKDIIRPHMQVMPGVAAGTVGIILWIALSSIGLHQVLIDLLPRWLQPSARPAFNPFEKIDIPAMQWGFITIRVLSLAILVPVAEELFWRGWLMRWIIADDWEGVEMGTFTWGSFSIVTVLFTLAHPEWLAAAAWCALINILLYWKKDLWNCIVAHAVTNLLLAVYVIGYGAWELW